MGLEARYPELTWSYTAWPPRPPYSRIVTTEEKRWRNSTNEKRQRRDNEGRKLSQKGILCNFSVAYVSGFRFSSRKGRQYY
jgi:hypothetical protein